MMKVGKLVRRFWQSSKEALKGDLNRGCKKGLKGKIQENTLCLMIDGCEGERTEQIFIINRVINFTNKMCLSLSRKKIKWLFECLA